MNKVWNVVNEVCIYLKLAKFWKGDTFKNVKNGNMSK